MLKAATLALFVGLLTACSTPHQPGRYLLSLHTGLHPSATPVEVALDLDQDQRGQWHAALLNGPERIDIPKLIHTERGFILEIPHYDSWLDLEFSNPYNRWTINGTWTKDRGKDTPAVVTLTGKPIIDPNLTRSSPIHTEPALNDRTTGRYALEFNDSGLAILDLTIHRDGTANATVLTPTGDYRYLIGRLDPRIPRRDPESRHRRDDRPPATLYLSTFDGAHMFALTATLNHDATLDGFFYSGDWWVESFTAIQDDAAALPNPFEETSWTGTASLDELIYSDLETNPTSVASLIRLAHQDNPNATESGIGPTIIEVFGSWCPNCHDAAAYLAELQAEHHARGLRVVGLAFELTKDLDRSITQVRAYQNRHGAHWPVLVAGLADKAKATEAFPVLDRIRSFPTTIFLDRQGEVVAIHTGFTGPATGHAHTQMRAEYNAILETILDD